MASQQAAAGSSPTAEVVGNAFVHQYYLILHQSPELVYRFYQDSSKLGRPEAEGLMSSITTMQAINEKIISLDYGGCRAEITTVDAQESLGGGVIVLVTGYLTGKDNVRRNFTQSFFLATQDKGYFVLNDIFRYTEDVEYHEGIRGLINGTVALPPEQDLAPAQEHHVSEQTRPLSEDEGNVAEVYNPSDNDGSVVEEPPAVPVDEVVVEIQNGPKMVAEIQNGPKMVADTGSTIQEVVPKKSYASSAIQEVVPKKSYASIVKVMKENAAPLSVPAPAPARSAPSNPERQAAPPPAPSPAVESPASNSNTANTVDSRSIPEAEVDGYSIYIRNLPLNATPAQLEKEFKKFGPIKSGGVQVRSNKQQGFCFGFVEFEVASAVQSAIEASPIMIGARQSFVEEKRPGSRVGNRSRFPPVRGTGFRNDGQRGRGGNPGNARNYGRGDFNNRTDFVNRGSSGKGPSSSRGGDVGYQRVDHMWNNGGGRMNRPSGPAVNAAAKTVAPQVSASA